MINKVQTKTITEIYDKETDNLSIFCFSSLKEDGSENPAIYSVRILEEPTTINNVVGVEGELLVVSEDGNTANLNSSGEMIIDVPTDDADKYSIDETNGDLIYGE